jgi:hypothetical protein
MDDYWLLDYMFYVVGRRFRAILLSAFVWRRREIIDFKFHRARSLEIEYIVILAVYIAPSSSLLQP